jgi:hypothetical protein
MARARVSTTVDQQLLSRAGLQAGRTDGALLDEALACLLAHRREAEIDAAYSVYDEYPLAEPDKWGDLASFRSAASAT